MTQLSDELTADIQRLQVQAGEQAVIDSLKGSGLKFEANPTAPLVSKWVPTTNLMMLRRLGKLLEECGELVDVAARCIIQGIDEVDPGTGRVNRLRLEDEIADVIAQCRMANEHLGLNEAAIEKRVANKIERSLEWEAMFHGD